MGYPNEHISGGVEQINKISVFRNGTWSFGNLSDLSFSPLSTGADRVFYSKLKVRTGILFSNETNPVKTQTVGEINDFIFVDSSGNLSIIPLAKARLVYGLS